ncbi:MAG TPA: hemolysin III family protein [Candidatus Avimonoglobus intestinipullorum]|uniref:Hemolysin III family protein n=1 Tax=Candidatus Avimonoglobus intestinipullorum TaxID=2840699 RepID=A0A9D1LWD5_9FIRM|nr:hemolysin III family protein [Candidatus Avimonoglobus intestinipullorum]
MREQKSALYTVGEEIFNSVSHGVGALLSVAALTLLIVFAVFRSDGYGLASAIVFGVSLTLLYSMSTVYHIIQNETAKKVLRVFDHCSIFILIAGTYTPYLLMCMRNALGWTMFGLIWGVTVLGIVLNAVNLERFRRFSLVCYICMGWAIVFTIKPIIQNIALPGVVLLITGGVVYTIGVIFYVLKRYRYMHSIWHLFVLGGSVCHYLSVLLYVLK